MPCTIAKKFSLSASSVTKPEIPRCPGGWLAGSSHASQYGPRIVHSRRSSLSSRNAPLRVATVNRVFGIVSPRSRVPVESVADRRLLRGETPWLQQSHRSRAQGLSRFEQGLQVAENE